MAAQKYKNILLQAALKYFCKNGGSWELLSFSSDLKYWSAISFQKKFNFEGLQPMNGIKAFWWRHKISW